MNAEQTVTELGRVLDRAWDEGKIQRRRADDAERELVARRAAEQAGLTVRELEVLRLIVAGMNNRQIAARLFITRETVKFHCGEMYRRLGVRDRTQAAVWACRHHIGEAF